MFGLGKRRTKFGRWLDREGITQLEIEKKAKLGRATVSRLCNDADYSPKYSTEVKLRRALEKLGRRLPDDYFDA
jgi:transcriptional regulator with XRE-family HTH domain